MSRPLARTVLPVLALGLAIASAAACSDDDEEEARPTPTASGNPTPSGSASPTPTPTPTPDATPRFAFGITDGQPLSAAPFPNDLLRSAAGRVQVPPLADDPRISQLAKPEVLALTSAAMAEREGFGAGMATYFFTNADVDISSVHGRVHIVPLAGPEADASVAAQAFWSASARAVGVMPAWGSWLMSDSTYAVLIERGVRTTGGAELAPSEDFQLLVAAEVPEPPAAPGFERARAAYAPLRTWLAAEQRDATSFLVGTVFTTEPVLDYGRAVIRGVDAFTLEPPTRRWRYDAEQSAFETAEPVSGEGLAAHFGTPQAPFAAVPGQWGSGTRDDAGQLEGQEGRYTGGTLHAGIGMVIDGSYVAPAFNYAEDGERAVTSGLRFTGEGAERRATTTVKTMVPFTLYLCDTHLADPSNVPVLVFTHGGGAVRTDAVAWATLGCQLGVATIAHDVYAHGTRTATTWLAADKLLAASHTDAYNVFTGQRQGDAGFAGDRVGDAIDPARHVAPLFAFAEYVHPGIAEATLLSYATDVATLVRLLKDGDWSGVLEGLSFDGEHIFHGSLSFGTSFSTSTMALLDDFAGILSSVGTVDVLMQNIIHSPTNSAQAPAVVYAGLGLRTPVEKLKEGGWHDFTVNLLQWLIGRGDPYVWAPYVLRHREGDKRLSILSSGNSWDETLWNGAQITYAHALGLEELTAGAAWTLHDTVPGAAAVDASVSPLEVSANVEAAGRTHTAAIYYWNEGCHAHVVTPVCAQNYERPWPPVQRLAENRAYPSPICEYQRSALTFMQSLLGGAEVGTIVPPSGTCEDLYGGQ